MLPPPPSPPPHLAPGRNEKTSTSLCLLEWKIGKSLQVGTVIFSFLYIIKVDEETAGSTGTIEYWPCMQFG